MELWKCRNNTQTIDYDVFCDHDVFGGVLIIGRERNYRIYHG
jgi:hypothetical protein